MSSNQFVLGTDGMEVGLDGEPEGAPKPFLVWPQNEKSYITFRHVSRLWRNAPMGGIIGFDWLQVETMLRMRKIKLEEELLDDLLMMENEVITVCNELAEVERIKNESSRTSGH